MPDNRIFFEGNPWPEGHPIKAFVWTAEQRGADLWFNFHLETEDYYAERSIDEEDEDEDAEYPSDWQAPAVWYNYHSCTLSSTQWHSGGFAVCRMADFSPEHLDGLLVQVNPLPLDLSASYEERAFHIYLLGHDAVAGHRIAFTRVPGTLLFDIDWQGSIALAYVGDHEPEHRFRAEIRGVPLPSVGAGS